MGWEAWGCWRGVYPGQNVSLTRVGVRACLLAYGAVTEAANQEKSWSGRGVEKLPIKSARRSCEVKKRCRQETGFRAGQHVSFDLGVLRGSARRHCKLLRIAGIWLRSPRSSLQMPKSTLPRSDKSSHTRQCEFAKLRCSAGRVAVERSIL